MRCEVLLTEDAEQDLEDLYAYIAKYDSPKKADYMLERLLELTESLAISPDRGTQPSELRSLGIQECWQVFFKPYRAIYHVLEKKVVIVIYVIADGRRDMQSLLSRRLLGG
jgi:toxin ParE1/3/4